MILDASAGARMMWKRKDHPLFVFMDKNIEAARPPDLFAVWEHLPFRDAVYTVAFLDPPHKFNRSSGIWADPKEKSYYGSDIRRRKLVSGIYHGTRELLRVAKRLCLKWCDDEISLQRILSLIPREWKEINRWCDHKVRAHGNFTWWVTFRNVALK